jgi:hypothetical protein
VLDHNKGKINVQKAPNASCTVTACSKVMKSEPEHSNCRRLDYHIHNWTCLLLQLQSTLQTFYQSARHIGFIIIIIIILSGTNLNMQSQLGNSTQLCPCPAKWRSHSRHTCTLLPVKCTGGGEGMQIGSSQPIAVYAEPGALMYICQTPQRSQNS